MTLTFVTSAATRATVEIDGQRITLRPLSFGEAGALALEDAMDMPPGSAVIAEAVRDALRAKANSMDADTLPRHLAAIDAHEAADEAVSAMHAAQPMRQEPEEAMAQYRADLMGAYQRVLEANRRRQMAEWLVRDNAALLELRGQAQTQQRARGLRMLSLAVEAWEGEGIVWPNAQADRLALLETMPAVWLNALLPKAMALNAPGQPEAKN